MASIISSFIWALAVCFCAAVIGIILVSTYGLLNNVSERAHHSQKKIIKAQDKIIASLLNSRNR